MAEAGNSRSSLEQAKRLERALVRVRWFGILLGAYLVSQTNVGSPPRASTRVVELAYLTIGLLALGNLGFWTALNRTRSEGAVRRLGMTAFAFDAAALLAVSWLYTYDPRGATWVVIYILPLEGALRYQLRGALSTIVMALANELGREAFLAHRFPVSGFYGGVLEQRYYFLFSGVAFRVGILAIIAFVAGFMARSLAREAEKSAQQAAKFEDLARREMAARRELAAFNTAVLTGVAAEDLDASMQLMADAIAPDLGFETLTIMLREGEALVVKGMHGMPFYDDPVPLGDGVTGTVAATGRPIVVSDVRKFPGYICVDPAMSSEMAVPMRIGDELIGVVDVESSDADRFTVQDLGLLTRVADQIALVAHSNRLLSRQRETMQRLQELDQMKSDFVAITSHELRTPITAIRGFVKTLLRNRDRLSAEQLTNFMHTIDRQSARLARLVEDLLFVSRIEAGAVRLAPEPVDVTELVHESLEAFGPEGRVRIDLNVLEDMGTGTIDAQRVDQIVRNLVENALKFSPRDARVSVSAGAAAGLRTLEVADRGAGIPPEDLPLIFDRFHQAGHVMTRENEGAGLGLYITKRLVEAMGGTIGVRSEPGRGSTFTVSIPLGATESEATRLVPDVSGNGEHAAGQGPPRTAPARPGAREGPSKAPSPSGLTRAEPPRLPSPAAAPRKRPPARPAGSGR
jgi:signal transduction histidine kinase